MASLIDRIQASVSELSKSERRVASAVIEDPALCVSLTIGQLAKKAGVSEPTVHRFCKHYGANGFPDFKLALNATLSQENYRKVRSVENGDTVEDIIHKVCNSTVYALNNSVVKTDSTILARAIDLVSQARRVMIAASGMNSSSAVFMQELLLSMGLNCEYESDSLKLNLNAVSLRAGDLLLALSASGEDRDTIAVCSKVKEQGVSIVTICPEGSTLYDLSLINIICGKKGDEGEDLSMLYLLQKVYLKILVSGVKLRRLDLIGAYKNRINEIYMSSLVSLDSRSNTMSIDADADKKSESLRPDEPITTINWNF